MLALLCSGQGHQHSGMFKLAGGHRAVQPIFTMAARRLGADPRDWVRAAEPESLRSNRFAQVLCVTEALAVHRIIRAALPDRLIVVGYSVGQVAAWGVAGLLTEDATLSLVAQRAELMDQLSNGTDQMTSVRGLPWGRIADLARYYGVELAIVNPGAAYVLGGPSEAMEAFRKAAAAAGAHRVGRLAVSVASHTSRFAKAVPLLRGAIWAAAPVPPRRGITLLDGLEGTAPITLEQHVDALSRQIAETIDWAACLESAKEHGATAFLELGPGRALAEMVASTFPDASARSIEDFTTPGGLVHWLSAALQDGR